MCLIWIKKTTLIWFSLLILLILYTFLDPIQAITFISIVSNDVPWGSR